MAIKFLNSVNADSGVLYVDAANDRVGIGTTSPAAVFEVITVDANRYIRFKAPNGEERFEFYTGGTGNPAGLFMYQSDGTTRNVQISAGGASFLNGGNVGIGTTSPSKKLHVSGDSQFDASGSGQTILVGRANGQPSIKAQTDNGGYLILDSTSNFMSLNHYVGQNIVLVAGGGNVGIGTTSPSHKLHVEGFIATNDSSNASGLLIRKAGSTIGFVGQSGGWVGDTTDDLALSGETGKNIRFYTNGSITERMRITNTGNVGIGTTAPAAKLEVDGTVNASQLFLSAIANKVYSSGAGDTHGQIYINPIRNNRTLAITTQQISAGEDIDGTAIDVFYTNTGSANDLLFKNGGVNTMVLKYNNRIGIGTTNPSEKLHVNEGNIRLEASTDGGNGILRLYDSSNTESGQIYPHSGDLRIYSANDVLFNNSGNIGIGTTSPNAKLDVNNSTVGEYAYFGSGSTRQLRLSSYNTVSDHAGHKINASSGNGEITLATNSIAALTVKNDQSLQFNSYGAGYLKSDASGNITVDSDTIEDTLDSVTTRGNTTTNDITVGNYISFTTGSSIPVASVSHHTNGYLYIKGGTGGAAIGDDGYGTSIYLPDSGDIQFTAGASERMRITSTGNVGIGTTSPQEELEVKSASFSTVAVNTDRNAAGENIGSFAFYGHNNATTPENLLYSRVMGSMTDVTDGSEDGDIYFQQIKDGSIGETFRVKSNGNVGIGTSSPIQKLHIHGGSTHSYLHFSNTDTGTTDSDGVDIGINTSEEAIIWQRENNIIKFGTNSTERMRITNSGNVGIGTASPVNAGGNASWLTINAPVSSSAYSGGIAYTIDDTVKAYHYVESGYLRHQGQSGVGHRFTVNAGTQAMLINTSGNVGIGTTSPSAKLHIANTSGDANIVLAGSSGQVLSIDQNSIRTTTASQIAIFTNSTTTNGLYINSAGNIGVGTTSPSEKLHVSGDVRIEGDLTVNGSYTQIDTDVNTTEQWNVTNDGTGPAVTINQTGSQDIMDVQDDGTSVFYIEDGGNVGIGTTDPATNVDVKSDANPTIRITSGKDGTWTADEEIGSIEFYSSDTSGVGVGVRSAIRSLAYDNFGSRSELTFSTTGSAGDTENMRITSYGKLKLNQYGSNTFTGTAAYALAVDSSGNVIETSYIPSSSSTDFVAVAGDTMTGGLNIEVSTSNTQLKLKRTTTATGEFNIYTNTDSLYFNNVGQGTYPMIIDSNDRVGIGTTNPVRELHLHSASNTQMQFTDNGTGSNDTDGLRIGWNGSVGQMYLFEDADIRFATNNSEKVRITSSGNVGIGTTSPGAKLDIYNADTSANQLALKVDQRDGSAAIANFYQVGTETHSFTTTGTNSGVFTMKSGGSNVVQVSTSGNSYFNGGNVGIGTASPAKKLEVSSATDATISIASSDTSINAGQAIGILEFASNNETSLSQAYTPFSKIKGISESAVVGTGSVDGAITFETASANVFSERMRITSDGNVGIGTTSPASKLDVKGVAIIDGGTGVSSSGVLHVRQNGDGSSNGIALTSSHGTSHRIWKDANGKLNFGPSSLPSAFVQDLSGNVGIGTTSPGHKLEIYATGDSLSVGDNSNSQTYMRFANSRTMIGYGGADAVVQAGSGKGISFNVNDDSFNSGSAVKITSDGNVGIGTTSPDFKLDVAGDIGMDGKLYHNGDHNTYIGFTGDTQTFRTGGADRVTINNTGVGIGTTSPASKLQVNVGTDQNVAINSTGGVARISAYDDAVANSVPLIINGSDLRFTNNTSEAVRITSGNVGIGTTSPTSKLHVVGDTAITGNLTVDGNIDLDTKGDYITFYGNGAVNHSITSRDVYGNADDDIRINSYHNVYINLDSNNNNASNDTGFFIGEHGGGNATIANNKFAVYADGNVQIGGNVTAGNDSGIYSFSDTVNASSSEDIFSISNQHGSQAFRVTFVCSTSAYSVAKTFEVVHSYGNAPVFFKVVDTGAYGGHDFDVSFTNDATDDSKVVCSITNNSTTVNANIVSTVFLGGSPTAITVTAL